MRRGRHHQRGRPRLRPFCREEVRRHLRSPAYCGDPFVHARELRRLWEDDLGLRLAYALRRPRNDGYRRRRRRAGEAVAARYLRRGVPRCCGNIFGRCPAPWRRPARRGARHHPRGVRKGICEEQGDGVRGPGHRVYDDRFPQRHRRHDHRDHVSVLYLGHRRGHPCVPRSSRARRGIQAACPGRRGILRRLRAREPLRNPSHDRAAVPPVERLHDCRAQ